jgi:hypothetical protein
MTGGTFSAAGGMPRSQPYGAMRKSRQPPQRAKVSAIVVVKVREAAGHHSKFSSNHFGAQQHQLGITAPPKSRMASS